MFHGRGRHHYMEKGPDSQEQQNARSAGQEATIRRPKAPLRASSPGPTRAGEPARIGVRDRP
jgi:hypothetical protein